jgi:myo-inositol-1(or 4)-monophosphatase
MVSSLPDRVEGAQTEPAELVEAARESAAAGAEAAMRWWDRRHLLDVQEKAASDDLVSQADREAESAIRETLARLRPDDAVAGEELPARPGSTGIRWLVDPIDGTTNYLYGRADWAVSVAATREDGRPLAAAVAEPAIDRITHAWSGGGAWAGGHRVRANPVTDLSLGVVELNLGAGSQRALADRLLGALVPLVRDVRRGGSAAAALAQVADGRADAYWGPGLQAWDGAAGALLVVEAGGCFGDLSGATGGSWPASGDILATARGLWPALQGILRTVYDAGA